MTNVRDLQRVVGGELSGDAGASQAPLGRVVADSRLAGPGSVFWALAGSRHDGNDFVEEAFDRGALGAVTSRPVSTPAGCWSLAVADPRQALWCWAAAVRRGFTGTVVGVTGSVGRTTARQMIHTVLRRRLRGTVSPRNYNNELGLPLSILQIEPDHDYAVLEIEASAEGATARLAELAAPAIGVITDLAGDAPLVGASHARLAQAKAEMLGALPADGYAVVSDDPWLRRILSKGKGRWTTVGLSGACEVMACDVSSHPGRIEFRVEDCEFSVPAWGHHHLTPALATVAVGRAMGFELGEIAEALAHYEPMPGRCEVIEVRGATIISDDTAPTAAAMEASLELLRSFDAPGRRIMVVGDLVDCSDQAVAFHHRLGRQIVLLGGADLLLACGEYAPSVVGGARAAGMSKMRSIAVRTPEDTLPYLGQAILPGDVVMVKGTQLLGHARLIEALRKYPLRRGA